MFKFKCLYSKIETETCLVATKTHRRNSGVFRVDTGDSFSLRCVRITKLQPCAALQSADSPGADCRLTVTEEY